jgi:putative effector of murein hydrolase
MLWTILIVLLVLWLIGFYGGFVTSNLIHLLLVAAVVVLALNLFRQQRNPA